MKLEARKAERAKNFRVPHHFVPLCPTVSHLECSGCGANEFVGQHTPEDCNAAQMLVSTAPDAQSEGNSDFPAISGRSNEG